MSATPPPARSLSARLLHGVGVTVGLVAAFLLGIILSAAGVDRQSPLLIAAGVIVSLAVLIYGVRIVARWQRRSDAEAVAFADQLVCEQCGVFPRANGIARSQSRARATVNVVVGAAVAFVLLNALLSGLNQESIRVAVGVFLLGGAAIRWSRTPRFACPSCKGDSVVSRQSAKGARLAATFEVQRAVE
ncbi:MAG: hypothetical protein F9K17_09890 [Phycisphaerae bacterium]|nr:MAG: hypothetical protein F9K17_09890 [Phycisphaerae bacterium]